MDTKSTTPTAEEVEALAAALVPLDECSTIEERHARDALRQFAAMLRKQDADARALARVRAVLDSWDEGDQLGHTADALHEELSSAIGDTK